MALYVRLENYWKSPTKSFLKDNRKIVILIHGLALLEPILLAPAKSEYCRLLPLSCKDP